MFSFCKAKASRFSICRKTRCADFASALVALCGQVSGTAEEADAQGTAPRSPGCRQGVSHAGAAPSSDRGGHLVRRGWRHIDATLYTTPYIEKGQSIHSCTRISHLLVPLVVAAADISDTWKFGSLSFIFSHPPEDFKEKEKKQASTRKALIFSTTWYVALQQYPHHRRYRRCHCRQ